MPAIAYVACQKPDGNAPIYNVVARGCKAIFHIGDYVYADGAQTTINGVTPPLKVFGNSSTNSTNEQLRYESAYGLTGRPQYRKLHEAAAAGLIEEFCMEDDHDFAWNNNDFKVATFKGAFNVADGTSTTDTIAATDVLATWRTGQTACKNIRKLYFKNQYAGVGNGDTPQEMVGVTGVSVDDFSAEYYYVDYDADMNRVAGPTNVLAAPPSTAVLRIIVPDCKRYTDPADKADTSAKTMLGRTQEAWLLNVIRLGQACAAGCVIFWTKDWFNRDNGDGGVGFQTYRDTLFGLIESSGWAVAHMTGDRHNPHAAIVRKTYGAAYNATVLCACPAGQGIGGLVQYDSNVMSMPAGDVCVLGTVEVDMQQKLLILSIRDFYDWSPLCQVRLKFGERVPSLSVYTAKQFNYKAVPASGRIAYQSSGAGPLPQWPASNTAWINTFGCDVLLTIESTTCTAASISYDGGTTFDNCLQSATGGQWLVPLNGQFKHTYASTVKFIVCPLPGRTT